MVNKADWLRMEQAEREDAAFRDKLLAAGEAHELMEIGYRSVSRKYCTIARVDREDWYERMRAMFPNCFPSSLEGIGDYQIRIFEDHYRRYCSFDKRSVFRPVNKLILSSGRDVTGFIRR